MLSLNETADLSKFIAGLWGSYAFFNLYKHKRKYVDKVLNCLFKLAQEKVWLGELTVPP